MGLLDAIFPQSDGGGLLDFLRRNASASIANNPGGLSSDFAQYAQPSAQPAAYQPGQVQSAPLAPPAVPQQPTPMSLSPPAPAAPAPQPMAMPAAPTMGAGQPGFMSFYNNLHGGGGLIGSIIAGATGQRNDPQGTALQQQAQQQNLTARALIAKGVPQDVAVAAVQPGNTELLKQLVDNAFGQKDPMNLGNGYVLPHGATKAVRLYEPESKKQFVHFKGPDGNDVAGVFDPDAEEGKRFSPVTAPPSAAAQAPVTMDDVKKSDPALAAQVQAVIDGRVPLPTGARVNPQQQRVRETVLQIDPTFDSNVSRTRQKFQMEYGSTAPNSVGGQKILMGTALGHLGELAESATKMGNSSGMGIAPLGHAYNRLGNITTANSANAVALEDKAAKFSGEVGKLYSGSQGGGVHEREETRSRFSPNNTPEEMASALEASRDLILSKQRALEAQAESIYGPEGAQKFDFIGPEGRTALERIEGAIARLRGGSAQASPAAPGVTEGATATNPQTGQRVVFKGGAWVPMQ